MVLRIWVTVLSVYFSVPTYCGIGLAAGASLATGAVVGAASADFCSAGLAEGVKLSISFFTMRPPSAVPFTSLRLIPLSLAILRARGDAFTRLSSVSVEVVAAVVLAEAVASSLGASAVGAGVLAGAALPLCSN